MTHTVTIVLTRSTDQRTWIATRLHDGNSVGLGATPAQAVEQLFMWSPRIAEAASASPDSGGDG